MIQIIIDIRDNILIYYIEVNMKKNIIIILLTLLLSSFLISCSSKKKNTVEKYTNIEIDTLQAIILNNYAPDCDEGYKNFCIYDKLGEEQDSFYKRYFLEAFIQSFDKNLKFGIGKTIPVLIVIDLSTGKIIRNFAPKGNDTEYETLDQFPLRIREMLSKRNEQENEYKSNKMHDNLLETAKKYYNIKEDNSIETDE